MQVHEEDPIPLEELHSWGAEQIGVSLTLGIIRSSSAIISLVSSSILVWILKRSNARFSSIYHRVLLGMSIADILLSFSCATFNSIAPIDDDYYVWNARGNQTTCSAQGFVYGVGAIGSIFYTCSLNLYSLAVVKYNKTNSYIRTKIEPFLHGVPIGGGFVFATVRLVGKNYNHNRYIGGGFCNSPVYNPPHCIGYNDGEVREEFDIPCGRGRDGTVLFAYLVFFLTCLAVPIIIGLSLWMIYRAVKQQEQANSRYGANAFTANVNTHQTSSGASSGNNEGINHHSWLDRRMSSIRSAMSFLKNRQLIDQSSSASNSRAVLHRAFTFTISYFLTWSSYFILACFHVADKNAPLAICYIAVIFNPLQGFFNLCIFLQPEVSKIKSRRGNEKTWCQAVMEAIWHSGRGGHAPRTGGGIGGGHANRAQQPQVAQPVEGERADGQPKTNQTQRMQVEAQEKVQQAPGVDGSHGAHVPLNGNSDQSHTMEP